MPVAGLIFCGVPQLPTPAKFPPSTKLNVPVGLMPAAVALTVAVNVTVWPTVAGFGVAASAVVVAALFTVSEIELALARKTVSPAYEAVYVSKPAGPASSNVQVATPVAGLIGAGVMQVVAGGAVPPSVNV
jgi:hypothetical protein